MRIYAKGAANHAQCRGKRGFMMTEENKKTLLNDILKELFFKILRLQEKSVSINSNDKISRTEMHALEEIQLGDNKMTLTKLAEKLGISKATASVCVSRLAKKDYIEKVKIKKDKRKSVLRLTNKGERLCEKHIAFHNRMIERLLSEFKMAQYPELLKGLKALYAFFHGIEQDLD